jgi:hypothetical protein
VRAAYDRLQHHSPATPWLAQQLASLVDTGECLIASVTAIAGADGRTRFGGRGMLQDMLDEAVRHPKIDLRRFARCQVCHAFFYRPRKRSRTCSRKCENILAAREHYAREKQNRAKALELDSRGKNPWQIGRELGIKAAKVGSYLAGRKRAVNLTVN